MSRTHREFLDSRESFTESDEMLYFAEEEEREPTDADMEEAAENEPTMADYIEMDRMFCEMDRQDELDDDERDDFDYYDDFVYPDENGDTDY